MTGEETNSVFLSGEVTEPPVYSHSSFGEEFFLFRLGIVRRSGRQDEIRVLISRRLLDIAGLSAERGSFVTVQGQIRTYNQRDADKMHLRVFVFCHRIGGCGRSECGDNSVTLEGFVSQAAGAPHFPSGKGNLRRHARCQSALRKVGLYSLHHLGPQRGVRSLPASRKQNPGQRPLSEQRLPEADGRRSI